MSGGDLIRKIEPQPGMRRPGSARGSVLCLEEPGRGVTAQPPADAGPAGGGVFGQGCGKNSRAQVVVVVNLGGCLARMGRKMRPAYWTRRPLNAIGAARNRVSRAGQSKCPGVVVFRTNGPDVVISAGAPSPDPDAHDRL